MCFRKILKAALGFQAITPATIGLVSVLIGLIYFYLLERENEGALFVTIGIGFFAWALAIKSESIINEIKKLVEKTNDLIKKINDNIQKTHDLITTIGIGTVYENVGNIEDWRLNLRDKFSKIQKLPKPVSPFILQDYLNHHSFTIWKSLTYLNRAFTYQEEFKNKEKETIIHQIDCYY